VRPPAPLRTAHLTEDTMRHLTGRLASRLLLASALVVAASCSDGKDPVAPAAEPSLGVSGAAVGDGTPGFHFLSPIAANLPSYPGVFDADRSPIVEVCELAGNVCAGAPIARFTRTEGTGNRRVVVEAATESYRVDWATAGIAADKVYRIVVRDGISDLGHADAKRVAAGETPASLKAQGLVPLGNGATLPIRFRIERNAVPVVTITAPLEGAIVVAGTPVTLSGTASDPDEGDVSSQIVWRSSRVLTPLGTGATFVATLPSGRQTISASVTDAMGATTTTSVEIVASIVSTPAALSVPFAGTASLPITLSEPAPAGGLTMTVASSAPGTIGVAAATVVIPAGQQSANATLQGLAPGAATVTVSNPDYGTATSAVTVTAQLDITATTVSFAQGRTAEITVALKSAGAEVAAPEGGLAVALTSADPTCAVASPVTIPAGLVSTTATIVYGGTAATPCSTKITASAAELAGVATDEVTANVGSAPTLSLGAATRVGAGLVSSVTLSLGAPAPAGGLSVAVASAQPGVLRVSGSATTEGTATATLNLAAGATTATVYLHGVAGQAGSVAVTATASGYAAGTQTEVVAPIGFDIANLSATTTTFSANDEFYVRVGVLNAAGTAIGSYQNVQPGAGALAVTIASSDAAVGVMTRTGQTAPSVTVQIAEGAQNTPTTVAAGGAAFDPIGGGTTTITATAPGVTPIASASQAVTVSAPTLTIGSTRVGAGLQASVTVSLQTAAPAGGVDLAITNSNPSVLRIAASAAAVGGAGPLTLRVAAGATSATLYLNGVAGQSGTSTLGVTAPGYTAASAVQTVAPIGLDIANLSATATTFSANDEFYVRVGVLNAAGTSIGAYQNVQPGAGPLVVTVASSDAAVGVMTRTGQTAPSVTAQIAEGTLNTATTVAAGGVAFDPIGGGTTTISATAPGVTQIASASQAVTVSAPTLSVGSTRVGVGLQGSITVSLQSAAPGGVTVTLASSAPELFHLATSSSAPGAAAPLAIAFGPGETSKTVYLNAAAGTGTATFTVTAPGYTAASAVQTAAPIGLDIANLGATTTTLSVNDEFYVRVGVVNAAGTAIGSYQNVRPGAGPLAVTVSNSSGAVGQLVRTGAAAQSLVFQIAEGALNTPTTVAAGGVAFDPIGGGTTTVSVTAPGVTPLASASQTVTVNAPALTVGSTRVGAGLQTSVTVTLGAPAPAGGLEVALVSSSPAVLRLATNGTSAASDGAVTLTIPAGGTSGTLYLRGVPGMSGTATVTASAPGFTNGANTQTVAPIALDIANLASSMSAGAANDEFYVRVGVLNAAGTAIGAYQSVQPGAGALAVTLSSSNSNVAGLVAPLGTGSHVNVMIAEGQQNTPTSAAAGGVALDPHAAGSTVVTATASGATPIPASSQAVTVNP